MMHANQLRRLAELENAYDSCTLSVHEFNERHELLRLYHQHTAEKRAQAELDAQALEQLQSYLAADSRRYVERMARSPLGYDVAIRREDGKLAQSITQLTLASAVRTVLMVAVQP